jgi:hypothetical protein
MNELIKYGKQTPTNKNNYLTKALKKPKIFSKSENLLKTSGFQKSRIPNDLKSQILETLINRNAEFNNNEITNELKKCKTKKPFSKKTTTTSDKHEESNLTYAYGKEAQKRPQSANLYIGERLYMKGLVLRDKSNEKLKVIKMNREKEFQRDCTFSPRLNTSSVIINLKKIYSPKKYTETNKFNKSNSIIDELNSTPNKVIRKVRSEKDVQQITEKLYSRATVYQTNKEKLRNKYYNEICTFKPDIQDKSRPNVDRFFGRLQNWIEKKNEDFSIQQQSSFYDTRTGQKFFQPKILQHKNANVNLFNFRSLLTWVKKSINYIMIQN